MLILKIIIAPDSFKDSISAVKAASSIEAGIKDVSNDFEIEKIPLSDGGDGLVESLVSATGGQIIEKKVMGPLEKKVDAFYGILGDANTAVIEMAAASGLQLVPLEKRNAKRTTTFGTGELILDALNKGCTKLIIGIGGSATNDGGIGMAKALGVSFFDKKGNELVAIGGKDLIDLDTIDISKLDSRLNNIKVQAACDVDNPLTGTYGATYVYGPQKGVDTKMLSNLEEGMKNFARVVNKDLCLNVDFPGAGAGGGFGAGIYAFLGGNLSSGIELVMNAVGFDQKVDDADLVITGEGKLDNQSIFGKVPVGTAKRAKKYQVPVVALAGDLNVKGNLIHEYGVDAYFSILNRPMDLDEALLKTSDLLKESASQVIRLWMLANGHVIHKQKR